MVDGGVLSIQEFPFKFSGRRFWPDFLDRSVVNYRVYSADLLVVDRRHDLFWTSDSGSSSTERLNDVPSSPKELAVF